MPKATTRRSSSTIEIKGVDAGKRHGKKKAIKAAKTSAAVTATKATTSVPVRFSASSANTVKAPKPRGATLKENGSIAIFLDGEAAHVRHFKFDLNVFLAATQKAADGGLVLAQVLRAAVDDYSGSASPAARATDLKGVPELPRSASRDLRTLWASGDRQRTNNFIAALNREGWPLRSIGEALVATNMVDSITRQAISLRALRAPEELPDDVPPVPLRSRLRHAEFRADETTYDFSFRAHDVVYDIAARRVVHEGAMMAAVLEDYLIRYLEGGFVVSVGAQKGLPVAN